MTALVTSTETSEFAHVSFTVLDENNELLETMVCKCQKAFEHIQELFDNSEVVITNVVVCRSFVILSDGDPSHHNQTMGDFPGPYTSKEFLKMMKYDEGISNEEWFAHLKAIDEEAMASLVEE
ncbi:MAG: hypothetical protein PVI40_00440 [Chlamydiota bacterium]|jgi:hypothetical protein